MKAKIKGTGEFVNVEFSRRSNISRYSDFFKTDDGREIIDINLEFDNPIDWEQRRFELVKAAMQGLCSNSEFERDYERFGSEISWAEYYSKNAMAIANAVIAEYRKGGER